MLKILFLGCSLSHKNVLLFSCLNPNFSTVGFIKSVLFLGKLIYIQLGVKIEVAVASPLTPPFSSGCFLLG
jgi:hypothetical protein